ncbi:sigma-54-dependent Fis family transcriptional regulator [Zooshikella sp. WH53]|uniref:Sigma-54-dependent Fis family transcriptional regulator n=1 Tax=Zooshikella harenae TaxID=2827238 RepID=A0ABS5Z9A1_9GAMM|nr:sigma-54 dependent transcriptional regulator [Zooshikella harenae]MBU2709452.1 sigma-54-dependent Fis family transcriptional regulator [Zooshikella harenae]
MKQILIVEDEKVIRAALKRLLERHKYAVEEAESVQHALETFNLDSFDLVITDQRLPGGQGTNLIAHAGDTPVLVMTSYASLRSAVEAMKKGAIDYIAKPFDHDEMITTVTGIIESNPKAPTQHGTHSVGETVSTGKDNQQTSQSHIIGKCPAMQELSRRIQKVSPTDSTVLILGESGTGKELVAKAIHDQSKRQHAPMISVNCAAIPETLIESELFGHEKGAFTGATAARHGLVEAADGGTLFLDEIGELPLEAQARLLRVLQEGEIRRVGSVNSQRVSVRLIAATHRNLKSLAQKGEFREDLYYRLNVIEIRLPPLRERGSDVTDIAERFLERQCAKLGRKRHYFAPETYQAINEYDWPGNVRELENAIERAVILCDSDIISPDLLSIDIIKPATDFSPDITRVEQHEELSLEDYFQHFVLEHQDQMTETELAQKLGISRKCLWERRQRLGIPRKKNSLN